MNVEAILAALERCSRGFCKCHEAPGLNPWVPRCPTCGCDNVFYDEGFLAGRQIVRKCSRPKKRKRRRR